MDRDDPAGSRVHAVNKGNDKYGSDIEYWDYYGGFTKFEECAMRFHEALINNGNEALYDPEDAAHDAINHAEAFFDALEKREEKQEVEESLK